MKRLSVGDQLFCLLTAVAWATSVSAAPVTSVEVSTADATTYIIASSSSSTSSDMTSAGNATEESILSKVKFLDLEEAKLKQSALVERAPELNDYVSKLVCRLAGDKCSEIRVYVVNQPLVHVSLAPNGAMQIYTGLLLRAQNEAQLAFAVGRALGHYRRYTAEDRIAMASVEDIRNARKMFALAANPDSLEAADPRGRLEELSGINGFTEEDQIAADRYGLETLVRFGYDPDEAVAFWNQILKEFSRSSTEPPYVPKMSLFDAQPISDSRTKALMQLVKESPPSNKKNTAAHMARIVPYFWPWLEIELSLGDYGRTLYLVNDLLARLPSQGALYYAKGEIYMLQGGAKNNAAALKAFGKASNYSHSPQQVWRELGLAHWRAGHFAEASGALLTYLNEVPEAPDRELIQSYLAQIKAGAPMDAPVDGPVE